MDGDIIGWELGEEHRPFLFQLLMCSLMPTEVQVTLEGEATLLGMYALAWTRAYDDGFKNSPANIAYLILFCCYLQTKKLQLHYMNQSKIIA